MLFRGLVGGHRRRAARTPSTRRPRAGLPWCVLRLGAAHAHAPVGLCATVCAAWAACDGCWLVANPNTPAPHERARARYPQAAALPDMHSEKSVTSVLQLCNLFWLRPPRLPAHSQLIHYYLFKGGGSSAHLSPGFVCGPSLSTATIQRAVPWCVACTREGATVDCPFATRGRPVPSLPCAATTVTGAPLLRLLLFAVGRGSCCDSCCD